MNTLFEIVWWTNPKQVQFHDKENAISIRLKIPILQISYKASLLHLQPRQMRLIVTELKDDLLLSSYQTYANSCSEDEDETDKRKIHFYTH